MSSIEIASNIVLTPQLQYLVAAGAGNIIDDDPTNINSKALIHSYNGSFDPEYQTAIPTGSRAALQALLVTLAGRSQLTATIAQTQINRLATDPAITPTNRNLLHSDRFNDDISRATIEATPAMFSFERTSDSIINAAGATRLGRLFHITPDNSYNQMATTVAFAEFIDLLPIDWFEVTGLSTQLGVQLSSLEQIIETVSKNDPPVGHFTRIIENDADHPAGRMTSAFERVLLKLEEQDAITLRFERHWELKRNVNEHPDKFTRVSPKNIERLSRLAEVSSATGFITFPTIAELIPNPTERAAFCHKYLSYSAKTHGYQAGFTSPEQKQRFEEITAAMATFKTRYQELTDQLIVNGGKDAELTKLFSENLTDTTDREPTKIGYTPEREKLAKTLIAYYLKLSERMQQSMSNERPVLPKWS